MCIWGVVKYTAQCKRQSCDQTPSQSHRRRINTSDLQSFCERLKPSLMFWGSTAEMCLSFFLAVMEKLMDSDFICLCQYFYNILQSVFCCIVPFVACFFSLGVTWKCPETGEEEDKSKRKAPCSTDGRREKIKCKCDDVLLCLFFFMDGRYVASYWDGEYTETGANQWGANQK